MLSVHARGTFLCYKYAVRQMIQQGRGGRIVGASSVAGLKGLPHSGHYCAAKFAIRGLTQGVGEFKFCFFCLLTHMLTSILTAQEVGKHGITVNAYAPGTCFALECDMISRRNFKV